MGRDHYALEHVPGHLVYTSTRPKSDENTPSICVMTFYIVGGGYLEAVTFTPIPPDLHEFAFISDLTINVLSFSSVNGWKRP